ncbi:MAG: KUP/HAK/KT family potassium transporter, partial [Verrucomicrobiae bacterium]|nr:KUP/HAK/KT family potassium transporter [Verrucomicrobiae bacterium]
GKSSGRISWFILMVLGGAALLYGDGIITPAISVLGAAEGLKSINPDFAPYVVPSSCIVLLILFVMQRHGTHRIGTIFGPVMILWFLTLGVLGTWQICLNPKVLLALNPLFGFQYLFSNPHHATLILGSVVLAITGAEALYADMGHFGRPAIARGWFLVAFPALVLNYFGQGAFALAHPEDVHNPFYAIAPEGPARFFLVGLAFAASVIASQALISGVYSLTRQAIQLGYFPRTHITHTNENIEGQIYMPFINWAMAAGSIFLVLEFKSTANLAAAYGIAVTGTMAITTLAFYYVIREKWNYPLWKALLLCGFFMLVDLAFFFSNIHKIQEGGWFPLLIGAILLSIMYVWKAGRNYIAQKLYANELEMNVVVQDIRDSNVYRVPGTAIFMAGRPTGVPVVLLHHLKSNLCIHKSVILISIVTQPVPKLDMEEEIEIMDLGEGFYRVIVPHGYMETPQAGDIVYLLGKRGVPIDTRRLTYYFNREVVFYGGQSGLWRWQKSLYGFMSRNARPVRDHYGIPPNQIVEMGLPVQL